MGGCRCSFRECNVATARYPNMHFFHFPLKDKERCQKWINMTGVDLHGKPLVYQKNRVVCARHFRDECFMNYKKDRLVQTAVPTLMRFGKYTALDYEQEEPTIISLKKPTKSHLIAPPDFKDPLEFDNSEEEFTDLDLITGTKDHECSTNSANVVEVAQKGKKRKIPPIKEYAVNKKPKILNKNANCQEEEQEEVIEELLLPIVKEKENITLVEGLTDDDGGSGSGGNHSEFLLLNDDQHSRNNNDSPQFMFAKKKDDSTNTEYILQQVNDTEQLDDEMVPSHKEQIAELKEKINKLQEQLIDAKRDQKQKNDKLKQLSMSKNSLKNALEFMRTQRDQLKEENVILKEQIATITTKKQIVSDVNHIQNAAISQVSTTVSGSAKEISSIKNHNVPTKGQLFKGIQKYLSSSMVALLRMEMFGNSDREWKSDELRTAIDLLQLGENVYRYFTDEWRLRLPAISETRNWLNAQKPLDEDEDF